MKTIVSVRARPSFHFWVARRFCRPIVGLVAAMIGLSAGVRAAAQTSPLEESRVRMGTLIVDTKVRVEQMRHVFGFGAALANSVFNGRLNAEETARYKRVFLENCNSAVTENALKWHDMEPQPGRMNYAVVDAMLAWTDEHHLPLRGHNIRAFLDAGVVFAGIGVQGHLHGDTFDPVALQNALDRLAEAKLPIKITEFNVPGQRSKYYQKRGAQLSDEEERAKAEALIDYYRICFAHPAVEGILMWGFWEGANWIPVSSSYRRDWTPTPAAEAYRELLFKEWWTKWEGRTDGEGRCEVPAFFGQHRLAAGGRSVEVALRRADGSKRVSL